MKKLISLLLVAAAITPLHAQRAEKYSVSTQMFLDEQAGRISFAAPSGPQRAPAGSIGYGRQVGGKYDRPIASVVEVDGRPYISAFVRVSNPHARTSLEALGVRVECEFSGGTLLTTLIPVDKIEAVADLAQVRRISVARRMRPLTNMGRQYSNVDDVLTYSESARDAGLPNAFDGAGVLLGVIDTGIDFQHKAFKDKDGNSRIKRAYVVKASSSWFGGTTYDVKEYGDGLSYAITASQPTTDDDNEDHGTHTSSTAGGSSVIINGSTTTVTDNHSEATYGGMAPGADLYLAGCDLSDTYLANSFQKICQYADSRGMPVVVSNSWGSQYGPHDGTGEFAEICEQYFGDDHPGHICLFAASNDAGTNGFHIAAQASAAQPMGAVVNINTEYISYYYNVIASAWARTPGVRLNCKVIVINDIGEKQAEVAVNPSSGSNITVTGLSNYISYGSLVAYRDYVGGSNKSQIMLYTNSLYMKSGYKLAVQFYPAVGSTVVDAWCASGYTYFSDTPASEDYVWTRASDDMCVSDESTIPTAISVGAYSTKNQVTDHYGVNHNLTDYTVGDIAYFSSYATADESPTGEFYPWVSAPGATVVSAVNHHHTTGSYSYMNDNMASHDMYRVNNDKTNPYGSMEGTSMSTPTAAGIVALWLQAAKSVGLKLTTSDVKNIMRQTAITDAWTNGANATHFGVGKIDALAGIKYILGDMATASSVFVSKNSLDFGVSNTGETATQTLTVTGLNLTGDIQVTLTDDNGVFGIETTTISTADAANGKDLTISFTPQAVQAYSATLTLTSAGAEATTVELIGSGKLLKLLPELIAADQITNTSFWAEWTDATPAANISSYTLWVSTKASQELLYDLDFSTWSDVKVRGIYSDISGMLANYGLNGWSGSCVYSYAGAMQLGSYAIGRSYAGSVQSPTIDLRDYDGKATLVFTAKATRGSSAGVTIEIGQNGVATQTVTQALTTTAATYAVELSGQAAADVTITLKTESGYPVQLNDLKIYAGQSESGAPLRIVSEEGDTAHRTITGITDHYYVVNGLTAGGTFLYKVRAVYADNTMSEWSASRLVTLVDDQGLKGDINQDGIVDVTDLNVLISIILGMESADDYGRRAYINDDENIDVADVNALIGIIIGNGGETSK